MTNLNSMCFSLFFSMFRFVGFFPRLILCLFCFRNDNKGVFYLSKPLIFWEALKGSS